MGTSTTTRCGSRATWPGTWAAPATTTSLWLGALVPSLGAGLGALLVGLAEPPGLGAEAELVRPAGLAPLGVALAEALAELAPGFVLALAAGLGVLALAVLAADGQAWPLACLSATSVMRPASRSTLTSPWPGPKTTRPSRLATAAASTPTAKVNVAVLNSTFLPLTGRRRALNCTRYTPGLVKAQLICWWAPAGKLTVSCL